MIVKETVTINGKMFTRTYSDAGLKIERDGVVYDEAVDPLRTEREYTETEEKVTSNEDF